MTQQVTHYARMAGRLLAHLEMAATDLEAALRAIPKDKVAVRANVKSRIAEIRSVVAKHDGDTDQ